MFPPPFHLSPFACIWIAVIVIIIIMIIIIVSKLYESWEDDHPTFPELIMEEDKSQVKSKEAQKIMNCFYPPFTW